MASRAYETAMEDANRSLWLMWSGAVAALPLFGAWGFFISSGEVPMSLPLWYQLSLGFATVLMGGMSVFVPRHMLSNRIIMEHVRGRAGEATNARASGAVLPSREERLTALIEVYKRPFVMSLALSETVALLGVTYVLLSAQRVPMLILLGIAAALLAYHRPGLSALTQRASRYLPEERAVPTAWPTRPQTEY